MKTEPRETVAIIGLGYVGLPLAIELARHFETIGFDVDQSRIGELNEGFDRTGEISDERLKTSRLRFTSDLTEIPPSDFIIVTVPTPIDEMKRPDLTILHSATRSVGRLVERSVQDGRKPVIVYESTVYPGVTEEDCVPLIEEISGKRWKTDFFVAYSPERINPGDREHTVDRITKVVSGDCTDTLQAVSALYAKVTSGGVYQASSIKTAEAAKVIENAQRDINIAFMNEIAQIFAKLDLSVWDVLSAANTKWNFLPFTPGLVGGHCIGVDPYYLSYRASELGHDPRVILAGRDVNDGMASWLANELHTSRDGNAGTILVLGMTFKEDVPDIRNSKVIDVIQSLKSLGHNVSVHDPLADPVEAKQEYAVELAPDAFDKTFDLILLAVPHRRYLELGSEYFRRLLNSGGTLADLKSAWNAPDCWTL